MTVQKEIILIECQCCNGKGEVLVEYDDHFGYAGSYWDTCEWCEGEGTIASRDTECEDSTAIFTAPIGTTQCDDCLVASVEEHL